MGWNNKFLSDKTWLEDKYLKERLSSVQIGVLAGTKASSVLKALTRHGIPSRKIGDAAKGRKRKGSKYWQLNDKLWLKQKYEIEQLTSYEIANLIGADQTTTFRAMKSIGIEIRDKQEAALLRDHLSGFDQLNDKIWLEQKYLVEKLSSPEIAVSLGTCSTNVINSLHKHNIPVRNQSEASSNIEKKATKYDILNDREYLYTQYILNKKSMEDICQEVGAKTSASIYQALLRHNIPTRGVQDAILYRKQKELINNGIILNMSVIEGCLLGDGYLIKSNKDSENSRPSFEKKNKFKDHIQYVAQLLIPRNYEENIYPSYHECNGKNFEYWGLTTNVQNELVSIYKKWYPKDNNYKKIIPENLDPTPETLLHWFMDDGSSSIRTERMPSVQIVITFCSECFSPESQQNLAEKINKKYNIGMFLSKTKKEPTEGDFGYRLMVGQSYAQDFFKLIGPPPVPSLAYKWK